MATQVVQEFRHNPDKGVIGDCWRASLASVLELPRESVPHFMKELWPDLSNGRPYRATNAWLARRGLQMRYFPSDQWVQGFYLASGLALNAKWRHVVVYRDGKLWWNPHPGYEDCDITPDCFYVVGRWCPSEAVLG